MQRRKIQVVFLVVLVCVTLLIAGTALAQSGYPPRTNQYVNDYAGVITADDEATLRSMLQSLQGEAGVDATVITIGSIDDYNTRDTSIESFGTGLFNTWAIDDAETNDGVLLVVAVEDRDVRIELGRAYGRRYDSAMQDVIDDHVLPYFREEQYSEGIVEGTDAMIQVVTGEPPAASSPLGRIREWFGSLADRASNNPIIVGVLALLTIAGAMWRRFLYLARGGCMREIRDFITSMVTGALIGGFVGSVIGMIDVNPGAMEQTMMHAFALFENGQYLSQFSLLSLPLWAGAGVGAVVSAIFQLLRGGREYRQRYGGSSGGGSSGGGGASGSW